MKIFKAFFLSFLLAASSLAAFDKVIIWGHKLHTNTFSFVFNGFYRGFQHLGYNTFWFDDSDDVSQIDFSNSLFITEGQVDGKIPLVADAVYFLHNADLTKYPSLKSFTYQVYTDDVLTRNCIKVDSCIYYDIPGRCLYMPWATDLLPYEIDEIKSALPFVRKK